MASLSLADQTLIVIKSVASMDIPPRSVVEILSYEATNHFYNVQRPSEDSLNQWVLTGFEVLKPGGITVVSRQFPGLALMDEAYSPGTLIGTTKDQFYFSDEKKGAVVLANETIDGTVYGHVRPFRVKGSDVDCSFCAPGLTPLQVRCTISDVETATYIYGPSLEYKTDYELSQDNCDVICDQHVQTGVWDNYPCRYEKYNVGQFRGRNWLLVSGDPITGTYELLGMTDWYDMRIFVTRDIYGWNVGWGRERTSVPDIDSMGIYTVGRDCLPQPQGKCHETNMSYTKPEPESMYVYDYPPWPQYGDSVGKKGSMTIKAL